MGEIGRQFLRGDIEQARRGRGIDHEAGGGDQHQPAQPLRLANGEFGGEPSAQRESCEIEIPQTETVEQVHVVQDMVLDGIDRIRVAGIAEAWMERDQHRVVRGPGPRHLETCESAGAVQEHQHGSAADGLNNRLDPIDVVFGAGKPGEIGRRVS